MSGVVTDRSTGSTSVTLLWTDFILVKNTAVASVTEAGS